MDGLVTTYGYDNINQLTSESRSGYSCSYTYDANGNRASRNLSGVLETYVCDDGDKLLSVNWIGGGKTFTYDNAGRRKTMTTGGVTTTYNWDYESRLTSVSRPGMTTNTFAYNGLDTSRRISVRDETGTQPVSERKRRKAQEEASLESYEALFCSLYPPAPAPFTRNGAALTPSAEQTSDAMAFQSPRTNRLTFRLLKTYQVGAPLDPFRTAGRECAG